jgi:hypothetical protein
MRANGAKLRAGEDLLKGGIVPVLRLSIACCAVAAAIVLGLGLTLAFPASAEWTKDQRSRFVANCLQGCQSTPGMTATGRAACPKACNCLADQGESMMTPAEFDEADKAAASNQMTPKMEALARRYPACAQQSLGK